MAKNKKDSIAEKINFSSKNRKKKKDKKKKKSLLKTISDKLGI